MEMYPFRPKRQLPRMITDNRAKDLAKYAIDNVLDRDFIYAEFSEYSRYIIKNTVRRLKFLLLGRREYKVYYLRYVKNFSIRQIGYIINYDRQDVRKVLKKIQSKLDEMHHSN